MQDKEKYLISVVTPVYNCDYLIRETAGSLLRQTFPHFEWIIVDDGSDNEQVANELENIKAIFPAVRIVRHTENKGLPAARNTGITEANGKYYFFLDDDDLIAPTFLEKALLFLELNMHVSFVNSYVIGFGELSYHWKGGFHDMETFLQENRNTSCFMARRGVFETLSFDESMINGCEDWDFWLKAAAKGYWGYTIPEFLFYYRRSAKTKWTSLQGKKQLAAVRNDLMQKYEGILIRQGFPVLNELHYEFGENTRQLELSNSKERGEKHLMCFFPWLQVGGVDQFNLQLLLGLKNLGWKITIITTKQCDHSLQEEFDKITPDIFHLANLGPEKYFASYIRYLIESRQPSQVFISHCQYAYYLLPWLRQQYSRLPVVDFVHCEAPGWLNGGYPYLSACYSGLLDKTFVTSVHLKQYCVDKGADASKLELCYINVDTQNIVKREAIRKEIRLQLGVNEETSLLLYVARLTEQKQPRVLVKALRELKENNLPFKCIVIGDGPERDRLLQDIDRFGLKDHVYYLGENNNEFVMNHMDAADIFFLPSLFEGIALSVYEAMAKELVIVGADTGGQAELVTADCGFLVKRENKVQELKDYIQALQLLISDGLLAKLMGKNGRRRVEQLFTLEQMIDKMDFSLTSIKALPVAGAVRDTYLFVLERMLELENENEVLKKQTQSKAVQFLLKYNQPYQKARKAYHRIKQILKK